MPSFIKGREDHMIKILRQEDCCGCTACFNICPKSAITMEADFEGFLYPRIDMDLCINCDLCERVCPLLNPPEIKPYKRQDYAVRTKDLEVLKHSTSGGFFTPLGKWVFENGGYLCAATYDDEFHVIHKILSNEGLDKARGSKYVQSNLDDCFKQIERYLRKGKLVGFIGTTCQVAGLKSFLLKDYKNLITIDLVCHGTPSPKLWDKYLSYQKEKYHSSIKDISFRNKTYGYHSGTMRINFTNDKTYYGSARIDLMLKSFFNELASRPICFECPFKAVERCSDFTLYDCWHISKLVEDLDDDDQGYTNVIIQSQKGERIFDRIKYLYEYYPVDLNKAIELDGIMIRNSAIAHPCRSLFYVDLEVERLPRHVKRFIPITLLDRFIEKTKIIIYHSGLYNFIWSLFRSSKK